MLRPLQMMCASAPLAKINSRLFGILHMEVYWWPFASYYFPTHQPTPPKRTGKPKCGRHRERLYLCTVPTNKFLCDPQNEKKKLKKTGRRVFSPEVPHTRKGTSLEYECVMVNSEDREGGCAIWQNCWSCIFLPFIYAGIKKKKEIDGHYSISPLQPSCACLVAI